MQSTKVLWEPVQTTEKWRWNKISALHAEICPRCLYALLSAVAVPLRNTSCQRCTLHNGFKNCRDRSVVVDCRHFYPLTSIEVKRFWACDVTSGNVLGRTSRMGGTGGFWWLHTKGVNSMAASGLGCRKALAGTGWALSLLLCMTGLRKQSSGLVGLHF